MYLQVSVGDLHVVHEKISLAIENQYQEIKTMISQKMIRISQAYNKPFYAQVITKVSTFALKKVHEQFLIASNAIPKNLLQHCSGTFKSSMGLPCSHIIQELLESDQCLQPDNFYQHWWLQQQLPQQRLPETDDSLQQKWEDYGQQFSSLSLYQKSAALNKMSSLFQESTAIIQDPQVQPTRGHPAGDPSTFELVMGKQRKCGICRGIGHNSRTCPNAESTYDSS
ncbi:23178_t:CDS:2 [Gigaspora margarita]|uniref:23178_t:CDS:1 n=1 Tax=Gigaspora margarita TaxID=4874 RepID=A0ABN7VU91_GIGMA|nr:23178_t:CDS:2 [Gigaspora margarita]